MCNILGVMDYHGFELVASVDQSIGSDNVGERESSIGWLWGMTDEIVDSWYFATKLYKISRYGVVHDIAYSNSVDYNKAKTADFSQQE